MIKYQGPPRYNVQIKYTGMFLTITITRSVKRMELTYNKLVEKVL